MSRSAPREHSLERDPSLEPYEALLEHAELELELAGRGEVTALTALGERWPELERALPPRAPAAAGPLLMQAGLIHERTSVELLRLRELVLLDLDVTRRARRTADGYAGQLRRRPRVDASA
jgi:hypothetical protein